MGKWRRKEKRVEEGKERRGGGEVRGERNYKQGTRRDERNQLPVTVENPSTT